MADWQEFFVSAQASLQSPLCALSFDLAQELLWTGDDKGKVTSYNGNTLRKYTSFQAHRGPVRRILTNDRTVISLGLSSIRATSRRGLVKWGINDASLQNSQCMTFTSKGTSEVLIGGTDQRMALVNAERGAIVDYLTNGCEDTVVLEKGRMLCCGSSSGELRILDPSSYQITHRIQAHSGTFSDLATSGNLVLTCGFSQRFGSYVLDPIVKVYDIRNMRPLIPIPFPAGPAYLKMHPKLSTTAIILSQTGQMQIVDVGNTADIKLRQANSQSYMTGLEISPSGDAVVMTDAENNIRLWGFTKEPAFTDFSNPVEFADFEEPPRALDLRADMPLNSIGMPYYREELLSSWPSNMIFQVGRPPPKIDADIVSTMKVADNIGYAPFHRRRRRNLAEETINAPGVHALDVPRFRSEKAKAIASGEISDGMSDNIFEDMGKMSLGVMNVPSYYKKLEIRYSKFGIEDFDFDFYNHTVYAGLETDIGNSYCNSLLQLWNYTTPLKLVATSHALSNCLKENCLLCELGYLFGMLSDAKGQNCQATNFLRTFASSKDAMALGLVVPETYEKIPPWFNLVQSLNRYLLDAIKKDATYTNHAVAAIADSHLYSDIEAAISIKSHLSSKCSCGNEATQVVTNAVIDLIYPKHHLTRKDQSLPSFSSVLRNSVHQDGQSRAYCPSCQQYQIVSIKKHVQSLPKMLSINSMVQTPDQWRHWTSRQWPPTKIGLFIQAGKLGCIHGRDLDKRSQDGRITVYQLRGLVAEIRTDPQDTHLVAFVNMEETTSDSCSWVLFNDFLVKPVTEEEATGFPGPWKVPAVVTYEQLKVIDFREALPLKVDISILFSEYSLSRTPRRFGPFQLLGEAETPTSDTLVAIDAEFVALQQEEIEVRSDGTKHTIQPSRLSLARVSVLRGSGDKLGLPFIDDYISTTRSIANYLTEYSGISEGDLHPNTSDHYLVPLKFAYKKLHALVRTGCKFIGHGLRSDFRIINMNLPKEQVIDTVDLFFISNRQRKLSLKFLSWYFLDERIQQTTHDSIEDARTALLLYYKYLEFERNGIVETKLKEVYEEGRKLNFKPPGTF